MGTQQEVTIHPQVVAMVNNRLLGDFEAEETLHHDEDEEDSSSYDTSTQIFKWF